MNLVGYPLNPNDYVDDAILFSVYKDAVDFLITEDKGIQKKSDSLGIKDRVLYIDEALPIFGKNIFDEKVSHPPALKEEFVYNLDIDDSFFDSLKKDYKEFEIWFKERKKEGRKCWVYFKEDGSIGALLIYKVENEPIDSVPPLPAKQRLKLSTFQATHTGYKIGELFIKLAVEYCIKNNLSEIYLTYFTKPDDYLIDLITAYGFYKAAKKRNGEDVFVKELLPDKEKIRSLIVGLIFVVIYLFQDMIKFTATGSGDLKDSGGNASFLIDMMEMYVMNNSLKRLQGNTVLLQSIVAVLSRILGPVVHLSFPKFTFDRILIYKNPEVVKLIKELNADNTVHKEHDNICLKYIDGCPEWKFFEHRFGEKLTNLIELSPKKIYPYLLDPDYSYDRNERRKRKWIAFNIIKECSKDNKIVGYTFLHEFKGFAVKRNYKKSRFKYEIKRYELKPVFLFTFVGERNIIEYLKYQIEVISLKVPLDSINIEINGEDIENYPVQ